MYICGSNNYNILCDKDYDPDNDTQINAPVKNLIDTRNLNSFSTYSNHTVWITKDGNAYGIGDNRECQFDPLGKKKIFSSPTKIKFLQSMFKGEKFISAVCGESYTLYLTVLEDDGPHWNVHFIDKNFLQNQNSLDFEEEVYIYGGINYAAIITDSSELYIYNDLNSYQPIKPLDMEIQDVALCNNFAIAVTENKDAISIPIGRKSKMIKFKSINKYNIQTISGTYEKAVAIASEKDNPYNYAVILFQYSPEKNRPQTTCISLEYFCKRQIYFKNVSCADDYTLLLSYSGDVYLTQSFEIDDYQKINVPHTKFIIAGINMQVYLTLKAPYYMPNLHMSEESNNNEEEDEEEDEYIEFQDRNGILIEEKIQRQKESTLIQINHLAQEKFVLQDPKAIENEYKVISKIGYSTDHSETMKVQKIENQEIFYALKILKHIHTNDYCKLINKIEKLADEFYHPLVVRATAYNYNIEDLENEKLQRLLQIKSNEENKFENPRQIEIDPEQNEEIDNESYHNLDLKIVKDVEKYQSDFYYPSIMIPYFPQNLFDAVTSDSFTNTDKVYIIVEILMTVSHLHDNGIYHQRLTPWNILISDSKDAFISDIFNSEFVESDQTIILKDEKALWFIDPEIINGDILDYEQTDAIIKKNHDIYSIGKLIYFILSGSIGESEKENSFAQKMFLQYFLNNDQDDSQENLSPVEAIGFPSYFSDHLKKLISDCISFTKEGRPSAKTILEGIKSVDYQLIPKVNEKIINGRLQVIEEKLQK